MNRSCIRLWIDLTMDINQTCSSEVVILAQKSVNDEFYPEAQHRA
jgi:hypothetical protein